MKGYIIELLLRGTDSIDWVKGLSNYLKKNYGSQQWSFFFDEKLTKELNHIRSNANGELSAESLLEQNLLYFAYLEQLSLRLGNKSSQLNMKFTWFDAEYHTTAKDTKYTQHTLAFEKSSIIYNIAVIMNQLAREKVEEDSKLSVSYLTKAFSCFQFLSENFNNSPSADLYAENTQFLANLCHAEAQEIFVLRLINGSNAEKQASLISKLATTACHLYSQCESFLNVPDGGIISFGDPKWSTILSCKSYLFRSIATHYHSIYLEQQNHFGEAIAYSKLSHNSLINALPFKAWLKEHIDFDGLKETINLKTQQLMKDNDYIYHDTIPPSVSLDAVKSMDAIKNPTWAEITKPYMEKINEKCQMLYKGIVPMEIYEKESIYSEEKANLLRREVEATETANLEYSSFIEFTNIYRLISDLERKYKGGNININNNPEIDFIREQLSSWIKTIKANPYSDIQSQISEITHKRNSIATIISQLPVDQKENNVKLKTSLVQASKSDEKLLSLMKPHMNEFNLLKNEKLLWKSFNELVSDQTNTPSLLDIDDTETERILSELKDIRQLSDTLKILNDERNELLEELKKKVNSDDITAALINMKDMSENDMRKLFATELEKFTPLSSRLDATVYKQNLLIDEIKAKLDDVFKASGLREKDDIELNRENDRKQFFSKIQDAAVNFNIFASDIQKGKQFYDSLYTISKNLLDSTAEQKQTSNIATTTAPPPLPDQPFKKTEPIYDPPLYSRVETLENQLDNLNISNSGETAPYIPARTYVSDGAYSGTEPLQPQYPLRQPSQNMPGSFPAPQHRNGQHNNRSSELPSYSSVPALPPKRNAPTISPNLQPTASTEEEENELRRNPTAFYNKSPVFDENLYFRYGK